MTFPLSPHPAWEIRDSSKLDDYIACPRQYFYRHILGWVAEAPNHDLIFGNSWHLAREYQLINGYYKFMDAFDLFQSDYRQYFTPETDNIFSPKNPAGALNALMKFNEEKPLDLVENEVVKFDGQKMTEISGTVPVDSKRKLHYRMDDIMRRYQDGMVFSWDHKSGQAKYVNNPKWAEGFHLGIQNGTYTHCLYCLFPIEEVYGIIFCQTGFEYLSRGSRNRPAGHHCSLVRVDAHKTPQQMNVWLWNTLNILDNIDRDMDHLFHCKEEDEVLMTFQMRPNSCTSYRGCPYHDFCLSWTNPLHRCQEPPLGFKQEFWNPAEVETTVKKDLEWR